MKPVGRATPSPTKDTMPSWLIAAVAAAALSSPWDAEFHIQPYLQMPESGTISVMWETLEPSVGEVHYGTTMELGKSATEAEARTVHEVRLSGLTPRTRYFYRVRCGEVWSPVASFRSPPRVGEETWRMVVYGDSRSYPERHRRVTELAATLDPDVIIHTGDQVTRGTQRPQWKAQFFDPGAPLFARVAVLTSLGNHEEGAGNYYEYMSLPGKEQYYSVPFANAELIALDSNTWGNSARDSEQYAWLKAKLVEPRSSAWRFVFFHHPLFSAHDTRSINRARWDWCPLFEELGIDMVLTGHDHFYARTHPIGRLGAQPTRGIPHVTTAGGGAPLYQLKERSYTAVQESVHHLTVMDFKPGEVHTRAIDVDGRVLDEFTLTKRVTPREEFCAYEVYELERAIREALESREPTRVPAGSRQFRVSEQLEVGHTFRLPLAARLNWQPRDEPAARTSRVSDRETALELRPGAPLVIPAQLELQLSPLEGRVDPDAPAADRLPRMRLEFADQRFRNREIVFAPLKVWRERTIRSQKLPDAAGNPFAAPGPVEHRLVRADGSGTAATNAYVAVTHSNDAIHFRVAVSGKHGAVAESATAVAAGDGATLAKGQHVRVFVAAGGRVHSCLVTPSGRSAAAVDAVWSDAQDWSGTTRQDANEWQVTLTVPRRVLGDGDMRLNVLHSNPIARVADCLSPTFDAGSDPDLVPDFRFGERSVDRFARLVLEP